jgi:hypothetical protein
MSKHARSRSALADPSRLQSTDQDEPSIIQVVIETPKGSRNKYAFDSEQKFCLQEWHFPTTLVSYLEPRPKTVIPRMFWF